MEEVGGLIRLRDHEPGLYGPHDAIDVRELGVAV